MISGGSQFIATWSYELYRPPWQEHGEIGCSYGIRSESVGMPLALSKFYSTWATRSFNGAVQSQDVSFPLVTASLLNYFLKITLHTHPGVPITGPGHLSIHYIDKISHLKFHSSRKVTHPLGNQWRKTQSKADQSMLLKLDEQPT